jgi:hypothetical protein
MIDRRSLLIGAAVLASVKSAAAALPVPPGNSLVFQIMRKGDVVGFHRLDFQRQGTRLIVQVAIQIIITLGPITLFRYNHQNTETWDGDTLVSFDAHTNDDGTLYHITGQRKADGLAVEGSQGGRYVAPPNTLDATHWNKRMLEGPMVNTQNGELLHPTVTPGPRSMIALASGRKIPATLYALSGDAPLDLWYDDEAIWSALSFTASDGSQIQYQRT